MRPARDMRDVAGPIPGRPYSDRLRGVGDWALQVQYLLGRLELAKR